ncbi:hypothetical protein OM416_19415 [Paenibacillus sp. LS1]|uniref:hypothetical protein n=1 Tax=Paenibacillus sp. LS1 TaxID=2992120 RepID=UPI002230451E|nr:hypothetical protein [Paenibacillus sp. LS1]MCW3793766.1 hypothetical protein [Paenibacillus sp. LS1]
MSTEDKDQATRITEVISNIFDENDPIVNLELPTYYEPLQRMEDLTYEVEYQISKINNTGHKLIHQATNRYNEEVLVFQILNDSRENEHIHLRVMVITKNGVQVPYSNVFLGIKPEQNKMHINDFRIEGDRVNRGYGSIAMEAIKKLVNELKITLITGSITRVDWDHIERSVHFYNKHGFTCKLDAGREVGKIEWRVRSK